MQNGDLIVGGLLVVLVLGVWVCMRAIALITTAEEEEAASRQRVLVELRRRGIHHFATADEPEVW